MDRHRLPGLEGFGTNVASVSPLLFVYQSHVSCSVGGLGESLWTFSTQVRSLSVMEDPMGVQGLPKFKAFVTHRAFKWSLSSVRPLMILKVVFS